MAAPSMSERIAVLEGASAGTERWKGRAIAFGFSVLLLLFGALVGYGQLIERVDNTARIAQETRDDVAALRRDLNARGQVPAPARVAY